MATMNVSLPEGMKNWVEEQAQSAYYSNSSDYIRDLIRRDQQGRLAHFQSLIAEGVDSGKGNRTMKELQEAAKGILRS
ncbi:type II toxin-antitoxin system ParD family antitoxin [Reinekea forsetii]|nr:type II toxin-antitoxin system ParD family antitoxin [Reinekea forsetii]